MPEWHEDDTFWEELLPLLLDESMLQAAALNAPRIAELLGVTPGATLLDLGCGPARVALELARLGYRVTGVDRTSRYLDVARERCAAAQADVELVHGDMRRFTRPAAFDGATILFTTLGYFADPHDDLVALRNLRCSLKEDASAVIDLIGKETLARIFVARRWQELAGGRLWLQESEVLPGWGMIRNHWIYAGNGPRRDFFFEHRIYSGGELANLMTQAGFTQVQLFGDFDRKPYDREAMRLIAVGRAG